MTEDQSSKLETQTTLGSRNRSKAIGIVVFAMIALVGAGSLGAYVASALFARAEGDEVIFEILTGEGLRTVSANLADRLLIRSALVLSSYGQLRGYDSRLQAGRYLLSPAMSAVDILRKLTDGDAVFDEITIPIPEGWTLNDIAVRLESAGLYAREEFLRAATMRLEYREHDFLDGLSDGTSLEGYLFPDTYRVFSDSTPTAIVHLMLGTFGERVTVTRSEGLTDPTSSLHELVILASIVQREAGGVEEMPAIAGVFWNRLEIRMPLESDATINYFLGTSRRQPTYADTAVPDPYNTYLNYGLPPGPIGNPGLAAISAVLQPASHDYLFFLHPLGRKVVFSRTYEEHLQNKDRFLD
ncbi:MAG: endolytic transglycosylase MltG [Spirochaetia bacterium]